MLLKLGLFSCMCGYIIRISKKKSPHFTSTPDSPLDRQRGSIMALGKSLHVFCLAVLFHNYASATGKQRALSAWVPFCVVNCLQFLGLADTTCEALAWFEGTKRKTVISSRRGKVDLDCCCSFSWLFVFILITLSTLVAKQVSASEELFLAPGNFAKLR